MRLTHQMRAAFVRDVLSKLPHENYEERIRRIVMEDAISQLPKAFQELYADGNTREYVNQSYYSPGHSLSSLYIPMKTGDRFQLSLKAGAAVDRLKVAKQRQKERDERLKEKLMGVAQSCNTTAQLREALPEFAKFVPEDPMQPVRTLPVLTGVVEAFKQEGWKE